MTRASVAFGNTDAFLPEGSAFGALGSVGWFVFRLGSFGADQLPERCWLQFSPGAVDAQQRQSAATSPATVRQPALEGVRWGLLARAGTERFSASPESTPHRIFHELAAWPRIVRTVGRRCVGADFPEAGTWIQVTETGWRRIKRAAHPLPWPQSITSARAWAAPVRLFPPPWVRFFERASFNVFQPHRRPLVSQYILDIRHRSF